MLYTLHNSSTPLSNFIHTLALTRVAGIGPQKLRALIDYFGSAQEVFHAKPDDFPQQLASCARSIATDRVSALAFAEAQQVKADQFRVRTLALGDADYPARLAQCPDAPVVLFTKGEANFSTAKFLAVVGTRKPSDEGRILCDRIISDLCARHPDIVIVSGLAFGVDITAHRAALRANRPTVAVVAHGLDTLYPAQHRDVAQQLIRTGALVTEFPFGTLPEAYNFVSRNRIIAGLADATLVVETGLKGGSLITTRFAFDYNRQVLAIPGFPGREESRGCNDLIKRTMAALVETADDIDTCLGWDIPLAVRRQQQNQTPSLFANPQTPEEEAIVAALRQEDGLTASVIAQRSKLPINKVNVALLNMEFAGIIKSLPGNSYRLMG